MENISIRQERPREYKAVESLTRTAFWNVYTPGCSEHYLLHHLRSHPDFLPQLSLTAHVDGQLAGHIAFTKAYIQEGQNRRPVLCCGPLSVLPQFQRQGIGSALLNHALQQAAKEGFPAVCLYGDPHYYRKWGFQSSEVYDIRTEDNCYAVCLLVKGLRPGILPTLHGCFHAPAYEMDLSGLPEFDKAFPPMEKARRKSQQDFKLLCSLRFPAGDTF